MLEIDGKSYEVHKVKLTKRESDWKLFIRDLVNEFVH